MKRLYGIAGLLVVGLTAFGCAHDGSRRSADGWVTLLDGSRMKGWYPIGDAN